jgi:SAM-dependent methyltransferase
MPIPTRTQPRPVHHPLFARVYAQVGDLMDAEIGDHRRRLLAGLTGRVLEVGAGNGLDFPYYPAAVTEVLPIEPEPYLRRLALAAARQAPVPIRVVAGTAEELPALDGAVDVVVASLVLCTVTDLDQALAETRRVLRPGGRLRCYEHVRATDPRLARWKDRLQRPWGGWSAAATPTGTPWRRSPPPDCGWSSWTGSTCRPCPHWRARTSSGWRSGGRSKSGKEGKERCR